MFRRASDLFRAERGEQERSPLWGTGYPRVFFGDRPLVPAGAFDQGSWYFIGAGGELYCYVEILDQLVLLAASGRTMLERAGLIHQKGQRWFEAHICADVGAFIAQQLAVPRFEAACDNFFEYWANDTIQMRKIAGYAPCVEGTHIACGNEDVFLNLLDRARAHLQVSRLRCWSRANLINDGSGLHALSAAQLDYELLTGRGPGHGEDEAS